MAPRASASAHPVGDLAQVQQVGAAPQVERQRALGEGAELALEGADVGVVDVAVGDVGDLVAHGLQPQAVGHRGHGPDLGAPGAEQGDDLVLAHRPRRPSPRPARHPPRYRSRPRSPPVESRGARRRGPRTGMSVPRRAGGDTSPPEHQGWSRPRPSASEASSTGKRMESVEPPVGIEGERGVQGQPGGQGEAGRLGGGPEDPEGRPGPLGVHVVGRDRGDAAPVVDARGHEGGEVVGEVGGRLEVDVGREHQPGPRRWSRGTRRWGTGVTGAWRCRAWAGSSGR